MEIGTDERHFEALILQPPPCPDSRTSTGALFLYMAIGMRDMALSCLQMCEHLKSLATGTVSGAWTQLLDTLAKDALKLFLPACALEDY
eukprot:3170873-Rhodomonas_salina.4